MPCWLAALNPSAICFPRRRTSVSGSGPPVNFSLMGAPWISSMARKSMPSCVLNSKTVSMCGCFSLPRANDFRRLALSLDGAEEASHMGAPDFRVGGRIFATLAAQNQGYGNLMLTPQQQATFVEDLPGVFLPIAGGWGRMGATHIRLSAATE